MTKYFQNTIIFLILFFLLTWLFDKYFLAVYVFLCAVLEEKEVVVCALTDILMENFKFFKFSGTKCQAVIYLEGDKLNNFLNEIKKKIKFEKN